MKCSIFAVLGAAAIGATFAYAQQNIPQVQHVIVVIQENRTPDNLFGSELSRRRTNCPARTSSR